MGGREAIHFITQGRTAAHASLTGASLYGERPAKSGAKRLTPNLAGLARRAALCCGNVIDLTRPIRCSLTLPLTDLPTLAAPPIPLKSPPLSILRL